MFIHVVGPNETINSIAQQYGVSEERIIYDNQIVSPERLLIGQALLILIPSVVHQVAAGDSISSVADSYGITELQLMRNNPFVITRGFLNAGEFIIISYDYEKIGDIETNGYAYPFIDRELLRETLPYLTSLSIFSYGFTEEGDLIEPDDDELIEMALEYNVNPILVLTPLTPEGDFNSNLISVLVNNITVQNQVIDNLLATVSIKNYAGVDVDFEFIRQEDRDNYSTFVQRLTTVMNEAGYTVSVALAPKSSADQPGLIYEGIDYGALGSVANSVLVMTYEWGYTYGPPMAVAPIDQVRIVLDFAVSQIPAEKIDMGIPNYGYDWSLPYVRGESRADSIGNVEAIEIAVENNAVIQFDQVAQSPFFEYNFFDTPHIVWFEDARSIRSKLELVDEYNLRGAGYWHLMNPFRANWLMVNTMFNIVN